MPEIIWRDLGAVVLFLQHILTFFRYILTFISIILNIFCTAILYCTCCLTCQHIFALACILRRPIIVYGSNQGFYCLRSVNKCTDFFDCFIFNCSFSFSFFSCHCFFSLSSFLFFFLLLVSISFFFAFLRFDLFIFQGSGALPT